MYAKNRFQSKIHGNLKGRLLGLAFVVTPFLPMTGCADDSGVVCPAVRITGFGVALTCSADIEWTTADKVVVRIRREDSDVWRPCELNRSGANLPVCGPAGPTSIECNVSEGGSERFAKYFVEAQVADIDDTIWKGEAQVQWGSDSDRCPPNSSVFNVKLIKTVEL